MDAKLEKLEELNTDWGTKKVPFTGLGKSDIGM